MKPEEWADRLVRRIEEEGLEPDRACRNVLWKVFCNAIREAVEADRRLAQARFAYDAQFPATWEYDTLEAVREEEREACAKVCEQYSSVTNPSDLGAEIRARGQT